MLRIIPRVIYTIVVHRFIIKNYSLKVNKLTDLIFLYCNCDKDTGIFIDKAKISDIFVTDFGNIEVRVPCRNYYGEKNNKSKRVELMRFSLIINFRGPYSRGP